jgi:misacylated tRNA(Ala) deacylase
VRPEEGRLQTAEHILSRMLEELYPDAKVIIAAFGENKGRLEIGTKADPRKTEKTTFEQSINMVIQRNLHVNKYFLKREEAAKQFDLSRLPDQIERIRIVEIEGFDRTPCNDPHVDNTNEIGIFALAKVERAGKDRYRFLFSVI